MKVNLHTESKRFDNRSIGVNIPRRSKITAKREFWNLDVNGIRRELRRREQIRSSASGSTRAVVLIS
jgi:hypothetical protein